MNEAMIDLENYQDIKLSESNRDVIRSALEHYRNVVTIKLYGDVESPYIQEKHDIELLEIDEILELMEEKE